MLLQEMFSLLLFILGDWMFDDRLLTFGTIEIFNLPLRARILNFGNAIMRSQPRYPSLLGLIVASVGDCLS